MRSSLLCVIALLSLANLGCGGLFYGEVEMTRVCASLPEQDFPAPTVTLPPGTPIPTTTVNKDFPLEFGGALGLLTANPALKGELKLSELSLSTTAANLDWVQSLSMRLTPPTGASVSAKDVFAYTKAAGAADLQSIDLATDDPTDLVEYLKAGSSKLVLTLTGQVPTQAFKLRAKPCLFMKLKLDPLGALLPGKN